MASIVVGGAGFLGSSLVDLLVMRREPVVIVDTLESGTLANIESAMSSGLAAFSFGGASNAVHAVLDASRRLRSQASVVYDVADAAEVSGSIAAELGVRAISVCRTPADGMNAGANGDCVLVCRGSAYGPRMRRHNEALLFAIFESCAMDEPLPIRGIEGARVDLSFSKSIAIDLVALAAPDSSRGVAVREPDFAVTTSEFCAALCRAAGKPMKTRRAEWPVGILEQGASPLKYPNGPEFERSLFETSRWFRAMAQTLVASGTGTPR